MKKKKTENVTLNIFHTFVLLGIVIRRASKIVCMFEGKKIFEFLCCNKKTGSNGIQMAKERIKRLKSFETFSLIKQRRGKGSFSKGEFYLLSSHLQNLKLFRPNENKKCVIFQNSLLF